MKKKTNTKPNKKKLSLSLLKNKKEKDESFDIGAFDLVNLKTGSLRFSYLYGRKSLWLRYLIAIACGIVMAFAVQFMIKNTGLYNSGLGAVMQGISRIANTLMLTHHVDPDTAKLVFNILFWGLVVLANLPLFIFGYLKIGKTFANLTLVYLIVNSVVGFGLSYIPSIDTVFIFGNTIAEGSKHAFQDSNNIFVKNGIYIIPFWWTPSSGATPPVVPLLPVDEDPWYVIFNPDYDPYKAILLFIYALVYGLISSIIYAILYIIGGCTAGSDFISIFFSSKKHKPLGAFMVLINSLCLIVGAIIGSFISAGIVDRNAYSFPFLVSANLVASFLSVVVFGALLNRFYPLHRMVKVEILSPKILNIRDHLYKNKFTHSMSISKNIGAYTLSEKEILWTICMYIETPNLIRHVHKIDPDALITITTVLGINGKIKMYRQGSTEK